jgi:hypothetical protein
MITTELLVELAKQNPENKKLQEDAAIAQRMDADPEFRAQRRAEFQREFLEGAKFAPFRIVGGPVDLANMALGVVGLDSEKPFLGSDYLIDKYATGIEALGGSYRRPTGSGAELAGDIIGSTLNVAGATKGLSRLFGAAFKGKKGQGKELTGTSTAQLDAPTSDLGSEAPKSVNTVLDEIYGQDTSLSVGPFAMPHALDHKVKLELLADIDDPQGAINIAGIVSSGERGEGFGTRAMKLITGKADENNLGLTLEVDPVSRGGRPDLSIEDLVTFYEREGFIKVNKNYNPETKTTTYEPIDPETNKDRFGNEWIDEMYRPPVDGRMQSLSKENTPRPTAPAPTPAPATITDVETGITSLLEPSPKSTLPPGTKPGGIGMYGINPPFKELADAPVSMLGKTSYSALGDALDNAEEVLGVGKAGMTGAQYLNRLKKLPSITDQELTNTGVMSILQKNKNTNMSPDELRVVYNENAPKISVNVRKASDEMEVVDPDTGDIEYVTVDDVGNPVDYDFVEYQGDQRLLSPEDDLDYYEILYNNINRNNNDYGSYTHYGNETGNFGHTRAGLINGPPEREGSSIKRLGMFVEEHQSDIEGKFRDVQKGESEAIFISPEKQMKIKEIQEKARNHPEYQDALDQETAIKAIAKKLQDTEQKAQGYGDALVDEIVRIDADIRQAEIDAGRTAGTMSIRGASDTEIKAFFDAHRSKQAAKEARKAELEVELAAATQPYKDAIPGLKAQLREATALQNQRLSRLFGNDKLNDALKTFSEKGYISEKDDTFDIFVAAQAPGGNFPFRIYRPDSHQFYLFSKVAGDGRSLNTPPFTDQLSMAKFQNRVTINKAMQDGLDFVAFPDYRDVAAMRAGARGGDEAFKITYKDARDSVLKELKNQFDVKVKTISPDEFVENYAGADVNHPVTVLELSGVPKVTPRRYAKGGPVDLRTGIGDLFRLYS